MRITGIKFDPSCLALFSADGVTKKYKETVANKNITVDIPRGKIVGFVGENGSGKTTFLRMVCGLTRPTSGSFRFHTKDGKCRIGAIVETPAFQPLPLYTTEGTKLISCR